MNTLRNWMLVREPVALTLAAVVLAGGSLLARAFGRRPAAWRPEERARHDQRPEPSLSRPGYGVAANLLEANDAHLARTPADRRAA